MAALNQGVIADVNVGLLYVFAMGSLAVYGAVLGGWASNNKYSLLGGLRLTAQMVSYELALGLSVIGVLMLAGSLSLVKIVEAQKHMWFIAYQPLGFFLFLTAAFAECARTPFDLIECENELVAGLPDGIQLHEVGHVHDGGILPYHRSQRHGHHPVPGRLARAVPAPHRLVLNQDFRPGVSSSSGCRGPFPACALTS